ncbi:hypothetical protein ABPG72_005170 [Tetrahymena utriculariae]
MGNQCCSSENTVKHDFESRTIKEHFEDSHQDDKKMAQEMKLGQIFLLNISSQKYEDKYFLPIIQSLSKNANQFPVAKKIQWKRIEEIIPENKINLFSSKIEPNNIYQGSLGDCYFLSALSTLAEHPNLISRLFDVAEYNPRGYYSVWLNYDGIWKQIVIDEYFSCLGNQPAFSKSSENEIWVMILEKAYANLLNSYHKIEGGQPEYDVSDLTGSPNDFIQTENKVEEVLTVMQQVGGIEVKDATGIISGHAYAILDAKVVTSRDGEERIIQLRNPWGQSEWQGDWSDKPDKWTPELKELCRYSDENDGLFWIPVEAFCQKYSSVSCNYLYVNNFYNCQKIDFSQGCLPLCHSELQLKTLLGNYIQFHQKDTRNFIGIDDQYDYSQVRMLIFSGSINQVGNQRGEVSSYGRSGFCQVNLAQRGDYFALVQVDWTSQTTRDIVISSYTDKEVQFNCFIQYYQDYSQFQDQLDSCLLKVPPQNKGEQNVYKNDRQIFRYINTSF